MILGITGGTGCGKTTLLNCIAERGGLILDCDAIYHDLLRTDPALLGAVGDCVQILQCFFIGKHQISQLFSL